jgi:hypothetical protein
MDADLMNNLYELEKAKQFELKAQTPGSWKFTSRNLKRAADKLYDFYHDATLRDINRFIKSVQTGHRVDGTREIKGEELEDMLDGQLITIYFLLMGYAFENLLKAILMLEHPEYFKPNTKMKDIMIHDLVILCDRGNISLELNETELLKELTIYIIWQGRYPIPLEAEKMWPIKQDDGSWKTSGVAFHGRDTQEKVDELYIKIMNELESRQASTPVSS